MPCTSIGRRCSAYLTASASRAHTRYGSSVLSRIRSSSVGVWWKLHLYEHLK